MICAIRRNVRKRRITAAAALEAVQAQDKEPSPKLVRWLKGRIARRKRCDT